jgi:outer membrane biosynthesis protein TonB
MTMDAVSEVLADRARDAESLSRMVVVSLLAHVALIAAIALAPNPWNTPVEQTRSMVISLGGPVGPVQGRNPISPREVQQAVPDSAKPRTDTPPALAKPEMIEPVKTAPTAAKADVKPQPPKDTPQLRGRTPSQGAEVVKGTAKVETGATTPTPFGGLATGGGGAGAAYTDYADFCCPEYLSQMVQIVQRNWQQRQGQDGTVQLKFVIERSGVISGIAVENQASPLLGLAAQRALVSTKQLPPLPAAFNGERLTVHLIFQFKR